MVIKRALGFYLLFVSTCSAFGQHQLVVELPDKTWKASYSAWHSSAESARAEAGKVLIAGQGIGYLQAHFDSTFTDSTQSYFRIHSGPRYHWAELNAKNIPAEILDELRLRKLSESQKPFSLSELSTVFEKIVRYYENNGHPFALIGFEDIKEQNDSIYATLQFNTGPLVLYDSIVVKGYEKIGTALPRYEWRIRKGAMYQQRDIDRLSERINSTPHLLASREPIMLFTEEKNLLYIYIEKRKASQFDGIIGLATRPEGGVSVNGNVLLHLVNSFNRGEEIRFHWTSPSSQTQTLNSFVRLPYLFGLPITPEASFMLVKQDSTFLRLDFMAGLNFRLSAMTTFRFYYEGRSSSNLSNASSSDINFTSDFVGLGLDLMKLNDRYVPTKGFEAKTDLLLGDRERNAEKIYQWMYRVSAAYYYEFVARNVLKLGLQAANINNASLQNEYFRYGGLQTFRGFNEQQFLTPQYSTATLEYRFMLDTKSYLLAFSDVGRVALPENTEPFSNLISFGAGLSLSTNSGVFNITWAVGSSLGEAINFSDSKIHFGYTNRF
jgi:outer membrane protein assembly factor BamA